MVLACAQRIDSTSVRTSAICRIIIIIIIIIAPNVILISHFVELKITRPVECPVDYQLNTQHSG